QPCFRIAGIFMKRNIGFKYRKEEVYLLYQLIELLTKPCDLSPKQRLQNFLVQHRLMFVLVV
ncbi:MAG TPA: hypothetical protein PLR64_02875, partial [Candidatus Dojkabacteria bacterium]|nr:hypothetical protein [Candidatus Dojkabacteria bacterium]